MTISDLKKFKRSIILIVLGSTLPFVLTAMGFLIDDHYQIRNVEANAITKEQVWEIQINLMSLMEAKTKAIEQIAITNAQTATLNKQNIEQLTKQIDELKTIQKEIDQFLREQYRTRGYNSPISEN